ncbi:nematocyst expressed protein 3-like [Ostrinia nubilalis]|uniref:nematocyst expressed protein 3-like n=1 Tax=Ostrinia nubilalis TaxID=29057 RepID=UPI0030825B79
MAYLSSSNCSSSQLQSAPYDACPYAPDMLPAAERRRRARRPGPKRPSYKPTEQGPGFWAQRARPPAEPNRILEEFEILEGSKFQTDWNCPPASAAAATPDPSPRPNYNSNYSSSQLQSTPYDACPYAPDMLPARDQAVAGPPRAYLSSSNYTSSQLQSAPYDACPYAPDMLPAAERRRRARRPGPNSNCSSSQLQSAPYDACPYAPDMLPAAERRRRARRPGPKPETKL